MPSPDERMMTTDPTPTGKPGWMPTRRGRYPQAKIQRGWEPRSQVGMGQSTGVGAVAGPGGRADALGMTDQPASMFGPSTTNYPGGAMVGGPPPPLVNGGWGTPYTPYDPYGGNVNPQGIQPSPSMMPGGAGDTGNNAPFYPPSPAMMQGGAGDTTPRAGGGMPPGGAPGRGPQRSGGGGGGGGAASAPPSDIEMRAIAQFAAQQWGVDEQAAMSELMGGAPEAAAYLRSALGMLRAGQGPAAFMQAPGQAASGGAPPSAPPSATMPPPQAQNQAPIQNPGPQSDKDYTAGVKANPVLHAAVLYGQMANAEPGPNGLTLITYTDGNRRWFHPDGKQVHPDELQGLMSPGMSQGLPPWSGAAAPR